MPFGRLDAVQDTPVVGVCFLDICPHRGKIRRIPVPVIDHVGIRAVAPIPEAPHGKRHPVGRGRADAGKVLLVAEQTALNAALLPGTGDRRPDISRNLCRKLGFFRVGRAHRLIAAYGGLPGKSRNSVSVRERLPQLCGGKRVNGGTFPVGSGAAEIVAVGAAAAACTDNGADIVAVSGRIHHIARIIAMLQHRGRRLVSACHAADRGGSRHGAGVVAVLHPARSPVLSRHAADVTGRAGHRSLVVATADRAGSIDRTDDTADVGSAGYRRLVAAVAHLPGGQLADHASGVGCAVHLAPDDQVLHRAAVYFTEQSDRRAGRDIQPADYMVATVKGPLERVGRRTDRCPWVTLAAKINIGGQCHGLALIGLPAVDCVRKSLQFSRRADCKNRLVFRSGRRYGKGYNGQQQYNCQQPGCQFVDFQIHLSSSSSEVPEILCSGAPVALRVFLMI